jgi:hypothetical protein
MLSGAVGNNRPRVGKLLFGVRSADRRCAMNAPAGADPKPFPWSILGLGLGLGIAAAALVGGPTAPGGSGLNDRIAVVLKTVRASNEAFAEGFLTACGNPCWVSSNPGGRVADYEALARKVVATNRRIIINGDCVSACALFADRARPMVRITETAVFLFHRTNLEEPPPTSPDISAWVNAHGGFRPKKRIHRPGASSSREPLAIPPTGSNGQS